MLNNKILKSIIFSVIVSGILISTTFAKTTQQGRNIINQLRNQGRTEKEIRIAIEDLGYDADEYLGSNNTNNSTYKNSSNTTQQGRDVLNQLREEGRTDEEIIKKINELGLDASGYFGNTTSASDTVGTYTSRSCKTYGIIYSPSLDSYTSPDLKKKEYFVSPAYFKRYIDSKNPQVSGCPTNEGWISSSYLDKSSSSERYVAPNGKVYFIVKKNGGYTSEELSSQKTFDTVQKLKYYLRDHNPLINMQSRSTYQTNTSHGSAETSSSDEIDYSENAKHQRDITRKNDLAQIQTTILASRYDNNKTWPGMENNDATKGLTMAEIAKDLETAGLTYVPFDPISSNTVSGLGTIKGIGEYTYIVTKSNGVKNAGFVLMSKPETEEGANRVVCDGENNFDNGYITNSTDINDIQYCTSFIKADYCKRDNQGRSNTQKCYYSDDSQLRYVLKY